MTCLYRPTRVFRYFLRPYHLYSLFYQPACVEVLMKINKEYFEAEMTPLKRLVFFQQFDLSLSLGPWMERISRNLTPWDFLSLWPSIQYSNSCNPQPLLLIRIYSRILLTHTLVPCLSDCVWEIARKDAHLRGDTSL